MYACMNALVESILRHALRYRPIKSAKFDGIGLMTQNCKAAHHRLDCVKQHVTALHGRCV